MPNNILTGSGPSVAPRSVAEFRAEIAERWDLDTVTDPAKQKKNAVALGDNLWRIRLGTCQELLPSRSFSNYWDTQRQDVPAIEDRNFLAALQAILLQYNATVQHGRSDPDVLYLFTKRYHLGGF